MNICWCKLVGPATNKLFNLGILAAHIFFVSGYARHRNTRFSWYVVAILRRSVLWTLYFGRPCVTQLGLILRVFCTECRLGRHSWGAPRMTDCRRDPPTAFTFVARLRRSCMSPSPLSAIMHVFWSCPCTNQYTTTRVFKFLAYIMHLFVHIAPVL